METANGLSIDPRGEVRAVPVEDGDAITVSWGKVDDDDADDYQDTLGIEDGRWVENDEDDKGNYYVYEIDGERYRIYQHDLISTE